MHLFNLFTWPIQPKGSTFRAPASECHHTEEGVGASLSRDAYPFRFLLRRNPQNRADARIGRYYLLST